jgi:spore germination protein GerM
MAARKKKQSSTSSRLKVKAGSVLKLMLFLTVSLLVACFLILIYNKESVSLHGIIDLLTGPVERMDRFKDSLTTESWTATLCFGDEDSNFLIKEFRNLSSPQDPGKKAALLVQELIKGPQAKGIRTIPEQTKFKEVTIDHEGTAIVDLSGDLIKFHPGGSSSEIMTVFSIVNTLSLNIKEIKKVKITIDGTTIDTIAGHLDCKEAFYPKPSLVH